MPGVFARPVEPESGMVVMFDGCQSIATLPQLTDELRQQSRLTAAGGADDREDRDDRPCPWFA
jgi:hypothetical protein